jgi:secreted PhoX family phosphatase
MKATQQFALGATSIVSVTLGLLAYGAPAHAADSVAPLRFTPISTNALPCSANGLIQFANNSSNAPVMASVLMSAADPATPINAPATSTKVGRENDMIALSPGGKYLFTPSENANPSDTGAPAGSDGITRLTLKGSDAGTKVVLADAVDAAGANLWQRVDGIKWYSTSAKNADEGVLLASEEYSAGGIWQVDPMTGAFARLNWLGNYSHEGVGIDAAGNLYLGDESRTGAIYKAVPNDRTDLTKGGALYYMVGTDTDARGWKAVADPANAISEASAGGAVLFDRPEDFDERNGRIYFTVTEPARDAVPRHGSANQIVNQGGVYSLSAAGVPELATQSGSLPYSPLTPMIQLNDPTFTSQAQAQAQQGLQFPDNLAFDGDGNLWVHEDIPDSNGTFPASGIDVGKQTRNQQDELYVYRLNATGDAIIANPDTSGPGVSGGYKAADMRTSPAATPCQNEFTGGIFAADGKTLFINQQHAENPTLTIRLK